MIGIAIRSGHIISAGSSRRRLESWRSGPAFRGLRRGLLPGLAATFLSACSMSDEGNAHSSGNSTQATENGFQVPVIAPASIKTNDRRRSVAFETTEDVGTVVVDLAAGSLYLVTGEGRAMRYRIEPLDFKGVTNGAARAENWAAGDPPPALGSMIRMKNPEDADDLHQRMPSGGKVVFLSSSK